MDSPAFKLPYQCFGIVTHQTNPFDVFENVQFQISLFPSQQYECPFVPNENGGDGRGDGGGSTQNKEMIAISKKIWEFALSKEIMLTAEYLPGRLNITVD